MQRVCYISLANKAPLKQSPGGKQSKSHGLSGDVYACCGKSQCKGPEDDISFRYSALKEKTKSIPENEQEGE